MNRDGREDIAVGAPGEDDGAGVVYIFLGLDRGKDSMESSYNNNYLIIFRSQSNLEGCSDEFQFTGIRSFFLPWA